MTARIAIFLVAATAPVFAASIAGRWTGAVVSGGSVQSVPISLELRQKGSRVIGVAITKDSGVCELLNGVIAGDKISFDIQVEKEVIHFDLTAAKDKMQGQASGKRDDGGTDGPVSVNLDRVAPGSAVLFEGTWTGTGEAVVDGKKMSEPFTLTLEQNGPDVSGAMTDPNGNDHQLTNVVVTGPRLTFQVDKLQANLTVAGNNMAGTGSVDAGGAEQVLQLNLKRQQALPSLGFAGEWAGVGEQVEGGVSRRFPIFFSVRLTAAGIEGKCGDGREKGVDIRNAVIQGNKFAFDIAPEGEHWHFDLVLDGDELGGNAVKAGQENAPIKVTAVRRLD